MKNRSTIFTACRNSALNSGFPKQKTCLKDSGTPMKVNGIFMWPARMERGLPQPLWPLYFRETGLKVGLYSSPHLIRFTERFNINGKEMSEREAHRLIQEIKRLFSREEPPTFFEAATAMALVYFARENTDIAIMEVGMGGRLDATNIIDPMVCGITNISMEHREYLGNTLVEVAGEKAGIIKEGVDLITAATQPGVLKLFEETAKKKKLLSGGLGRIFGTEAMRKGSLFSAGTGGWKSSSSVLSESSRSVIALWPLECWRYSVNKGSVSRKKLSATACET